MDMLWVLPVGIMVPTAIFSVQFPRNVFLILQKYLLSCTGSKLATPLAVMSSTEVTLVRFLEQLRLTLEQQINLLNQIPAVTFLNANIFL